MAAIPFKNRSNFRERQIAPSGSRMANTYEISIDANGHKTLLKTGETNVYVMIQADLEDTKIENILEKARMGDITAFEKSKGYYMDTTEMPKTLAEAQNTIIKMKNEFEKLPLEVREKFDYSPEKFISEFGSAEWSDKLGLVEKTVEKVDKELINEKITVEKESKE